MSVVVAVGASEGLVLATDSRTIQQRGDHIRHYRVASDAAEKLFLDDDRIAVATYGMALIGDVTIRSLMEDFEPVHDSDVSEYADALGNYFSAKLSDATPARRGDMHVEDLGWPLGFLVGGYDQGGTGRIIDVAVRLGGPRSHRLELTTRNPGVVHRGQADAIERMLEGVDMRALRSTHVTLTPEDRRKLDLFRYDLILPASVDDAVHLAQFLVETQIKMQQFSDGTYANPTCVPGCGGPVRVLAVTRASAHWVQHPGTQLPARPSRAGVALADEARGPARRSA